MVSTMPQPIKASMVKRRVSRDTAKFPAMNPIEGTKNHRPYSAEVRPSMPTTTWVPRPGR